MGEDLFERLWLRGRIAPISRLNAVLTGALSEFLDESAYVISICADVLIVLRVSNVKPPNCLVNSILVLSQPRSCRVSNFSVMEQNARISACQFHFRSRFNLRALSLCFRLIWNREGDGQLCANHTLDDIAGIRFFLWLESVHATLTFVVQRKSSLIVVQRRTGREKGSVSSRSTMQPSPARS